VRQPLKLSLKLDAFSSKSPTKRLEARVGIEQERGVFSKPTTPQLPPHHQKANSLITNEHQ
jgi:hypothetical protein